MPYTKLLNSLIEKSGRTAKEIAERCTENGIAVTPSYISTLRNDKNNRTPSDEMSRAIARACNVNESTLVIEAYIDNSPQEFSKVFELLREVMIRSMVSMFANIIPNEEIQAVKEQYKNMPLSEFIISMTDSMGEEYVEKNLGAFNMTVSEKDGNSTITQELKQARGFEVKDNSMYPTIPQGSQASIELKELTDYKNGDIVMYSDKENTDFLFRKVVFLNEEKTSLAMIPLNNEYETKNYQLTDIVIMGKVIQIIVNVQ